MMNFEETLQQVVQLLKQRGRISYRAIKRQFELDDEFLEDIKIELIKGQRLAVDEDGEVLVWTDAGAASDDAAQNPTKRSGQVSPESPSSTSAATRTPSAERRQLTVLFCDLVGSTALSGKIGPEEFSEVIHAYHATCDQIIRHFEGYTARYLGDGLLVYFGYPQAHEEDAQRAVHAALAILPAMGNLNTRLQTEYGLQLSVRIGIHTGLVIVGAIGGSDHHLVDMALGETLNIAARIQSAAKPDTVVVSESTHRLIHGYFSFEDLGLHELKGVANPLPLHQVIKASGARNRLDAAGAASLTSFVGRETELAILSERWELSKQGLGQFVLIGGEPGIGKSRLAKACHQMTTNDDSIMLEFRCSAYSINSPYFPIIDHLQKHLQFGSEESPAAKLDKIERFLDDLDMPKDESVLLLASLLGVPISDSYPPLKQTPERIKQQIELLLISWFLESAKRQPVLSIWEDLHWADPSTLELLGQILTHAARVRFFALMTHRPEFRHPWQNNSNLSQLFLNRFSGAQVLSMVKQLTGGMTLPAVVLEQVRSKTDGVPLFVEEVTRLLLESGNFQEKDGRYEIDGAQPHLTVPATLQDSLMARLDRMTSARVLAQQGAVIGREFSYELIQAVSGLQDEILNQELQRLVDAELLYVEGLPPLTRYVFKHALLQDVAYESLLKSDRQHYHQRIAQALMSRFPDALETHPEHLAHHYTEAGLGEQAVQCWLRAGERAIASSAHTEAIRDLNKGLIVLKTLPETREHIAQEVTFQVRLGTPLAATKGYCAKEVEHAYNRARVLCEQLGDMHQRFHALYGLWRLHMMRAEYVIAKNQGEELLKLYDLLQDTSFRVAANRALAATSFYLGEFTKAHKHVETVVGPESNLPSTNDLIQDIYDVVDPRVSCLSYKSWVSWMLGFPEQALRESERAIALARSLDHPFSIALALSFAAWLNQFLNNVEQTRIHAEAALALAVEHGFQFWVGWEEIMLGWVSAQQSDDENAIRMMRTGLDNWRATGSNLGVAYFLTLLAEAYKHQGQLSMALEVLGEAQAFSDQTEEHWWQAEQYRLQGEMLLLRGDNKQEAEKCFLQGLELARSQQARSLELRAAVSLARLSQTTGAEHKARQLLEPIYRAFTEGFDHEDLREAKSLLDNLGVSQTEYYGITAKQSPGYAD